MTIIKVGDVVIVPEGYGAASGKIGRVVYVGTLTCRVDIEFMGEKPDMNQCVRIGLVTLEHDAKRIEAEQTILRG